MADIDIKITDNSDEVLKQLANRTHVALEAVGIQAEGFAKRSAPVNTGRLRSSITHAVKGSDCYIGTNVDYAMWQELGTGIYASDGKGRQSPWAFQDSKGVWHNTRGVKPKHFIRNAAANHSKEYKAIIEHYLKGND